MTGIRKKSSAASGKKGASKKSSPRGAANPKAAGAGTKGNVRTGGRGGSGKGGSGRGNGGGKRGGKSGGGRPRRNRLRLFLAALVWAGVAGVGLVGYLLWDMPDPVEVLAQASRRPTVTITADDGSVIEQSGDIYGSSLELSEMPKYLPEALLATEDRRFYDHPGIDPLGIARAMWTNIRAGTIREGGSTLTQQLAKNLFLTRERSLKRKAQEAVLALWLEHRLTKDQILTVYLNRVYLGAGTYGVDAAAHRYFNKSARDISLFEAAVLAGLPKAPSALNPLANPDGAERRADTVLQNMVEAGYISQAEADKAKGGHIKRVASGARGGNTRYFAEWVRARAADMIGGIDRDIVIETTLDPRQQQIADRDAGFIMKQAKGRNVGQLAFVAMRPDGAVTAMLGGSNWNETPFNRATQAKRQPGSAFKLFVYLAGLEAGLTPDSKIDDEAVTLKGWTPRNASRSHRGMVTLREGFARSINTVAVAVGEEAGRRKVVEAAHRLGITSPIQPLRAVALGVEEVSPLELTGAYAVVANGGFAVNPYAIKRIRTTGGLILFERSWDPAERMISAKHVAELNDLMSAVLAWGTGKRAQLHRPAGGKTGTTQDYRDAWFVGYTPDLVAGVWMGNDDATPMKSVYGGLYPADLWRSFMSEALKDAPVKPLPGVGNPAASGGWGREAEDAAVEEGQPGSGDIPVPPSSGGGARSLTDREPGR